MKILLTGAAGFIGSNLVRYFLDKGASVVGLDNFSHGTVYNLEEFMGHKSFKALPYDVMSYGDIEASLTLNGITHVCHQAAWNSIPRSVTYPNETFNNNVVGFKNILRLTRKHKLKLVYATSSSTLHTPYTAMYPLSKKLNEMMADMYFRQYGIKSIGLRYFNVFGKNQKLDYEYGAVIPRMVDCCKKEMLFPIHGEGSQSRDFTHVDNVCEANWLALNSDNHGVFDIGCGESTSIRDLHKTINKIVGPTLAHTECVSNGKMGNPFSQADIGPAKEAFGYGPKVFLEEGLKKYIGGLE